MRQPYSTPSSRQAGQHAASTEGRRQSLARTTSQASIRRGGAVPLEFTNPQITITSGSGAYRLETHRVRDHIAVGAGVTQQQVPGGSGAEAVVPQVQPESGRLLVDDQITHSRGMREVGEYIGGPVAE